MSDQTEVTRWAKLIATGYATSSTPALSPLDVLDLAGDLDDAVANCILLAIPPSDWGPDFVNPALDRWEAKMRRRRGPRLDAADYALGRITMS